MEDSTDYEKFYVPAKIVQIPVENAIKNALQWKEGAKDLHISVTKQNFKGLTIIFIYPVTIFIHSVSKRSYSVAFGKK
jgi:LytS/YehU family sensor histidine kinase